MHTSKNASKILKKDLLKRIDLIKKVMNDKKFNEFLEQAVNRMKYTIQANKTIFSAGNGGSFASSAHLTAELVGRYQKDRRSFKARALGADNSTLTCIANDFGYDQVFSRELQGTCEGYGNVCFAFTTSGNSENIRKLLYSCNINNVTSFLLTGKDGGECKDKADYQYIVPSNETALIQEIHDIFIHLLCERIDNEN